MDKAYKVIVTPFDHLYILYTGLIIGLIFFALPTLITIYKYLKPKQHSKEQELDEDILDIQQNVGQAVQIQQPENVLIWGFFAIKWKKIERAFFKYFLSPKHRGWFIFVMLNIALFLCIIDILLKRVHLLTSWSLIPFIIASYLLLDTLLRCIKDLVK